MKQMKTFQKNSVKVEEDWFVGAPHGHVFLLHLLAVGLLLEVLKLLLGRVPQVAPLVLRQHLAYLVWVARVHLVPFCALLDALNLQEGHGQSLGLDDGLLIVLL